MFVALVALVSGASPSLAQYPVPIIDPSRPVSYFIEWHDDSNYSLITARFIEYCEGGSAFGGYLTMTAVTTQCDCGECPPS